MKSNNAIAGLLIAIGLLALGLCIKAGITSFNNRDRVVSVRGLCEKEVKANKVTWPIVYNLVGNNLPTLYSQIEETNKEITNYLTSNGISVDEYTINSPAINDRETNRYSSEPAPYRYTVTSVITVTSGQVDKVRELINRQGELLKKGIAIVADDYNYQTIFEFTELNDIKPEMIATATQNARSAAEKFASDSGSKIGKIKSAQQGLFSIDNRDPYTPFIKNIRVVTYVDYYLED